SPDGAAPTPPAGEPSPRGPRRGRRPAERGPSGERTVTPRRRSAAGNSAGRGPRRGGDRRRPADDGPTPTFADATGEVAALAERLPALTLADEHRLARRLATAARTREGEPRAKA